MHTKRRERERAQQPEMRVWDRVRRVAKRKERMTGRGREIAQAASIITALEKMAVMQRESTCGMWNVGKEIWGMNWERVSNESLEMSLDATRREKLRAGEPDMMCGCLGKEGLEEVGNVGSCFLDLLFELRRGGNEDPLWMGIIEAAQSMVGEGCLLTIVYSCGGCF